MDYVYYIDTFIVYTQKNLLCIHKRSLVHAQHSYARGPGPGTGPAPFLGPWPLGSLAQSMHKSVVHAQEISCVYTRNSFVYTQLCEIMRNYVFNIRDTSIMLI